MKCGRGRLVLIIIKKNHVLQFRVNNLAQIFILQKNYKIGRKNTPRFVKDKRNLTPAKVNTRGKIASVYLTSDSFLRPFSKISSSQGTQRSGVKPVNKFTGELRSEKRAAHVNIARTFPLLTCDWHEHMLKPLRCEAKEVLESLLWHCEGKATI